MEADLSKARVINKNLHVNVYPANVLSEILRLILKALKSYSDTYSHIQIPKLFRQIQ